MNVLRRVIISFMAVSLIAAASPQHVLADEQWCETDPVFIVGTTPIRVTVGLTIDRARVAVVEYQLHIPAAMSWSIQATQGSPLPESVTVVDDLAPDSATVQLGVVVRTTDGANPVATTVTVFGPAAQQPDVYQGQTDSSLGIAITLPRYP